MPRLFLLMPRHYGPPGPHVRAPFSLLFFCYFIFVLKYLIKKYPIKSISWVTGISIRTIICFFLFNVFFVP